MQLGVHVVALLISAQFDTPLLSLKLPRMSFTWKGGASFGRSLLDSTLCSMSSVQLPLGLLLISDSISRVRWFVVSDNTVIGELSSGAIGQLIWPT